MPPDHMRSGLDLKLRFLDLLNLESISTESLLDHISDLENLFYICEKTKKG